MAVTVHLANQPWGTKFLNFLCLMSPRTWLGALQFQASSPFRTLDLKELTRGTLGVLVPAVVFGIMSYIFGAHLLLVSTLSPWTIACVKSVIPPLAVLTSNFQSWAAFRTTASHEVLMHFQHRISNHRAFRYRRYDVFLPQQYKGKAILFFPGAFVDHTDYSEVAATLSDKGIVVVVVSMEPFRLAGNNLLGADSVRVKRIMALVQKRHLAYPADWTLGGHSLGSFAAMRLLPSLCMSRLVMWGSADFPNSRTKLSHIIDTRALVVQGSNDKMCQMTEEGLENFKSDLPRDTTFHVIAGASHNQFGSYLGNPRFDGDPSISKEEQHERICKVTAEFILQSTPTGASERKKVIV